MKKAVVSVTNDLATDQRVQRSIAVLREQGYAVTFVGRLLPGSLAFDPPYEIRRFRLPFRRGWAFYASYNLRLFFFLLGRPFELYWSNDLDTLLPNFLMARLRGKTLIYDSHEYFTGAPELQDRPLVRGIWRFLESWIFPRLRYTITVNESIAELYRRDYGAKPLVIRNIATCEVPEPASRRELGLPEDAFLLINQGSGINRDRGMEETLEALSLLPSRFHLVLVGRGDVLDLLRERARKEGLEDRLHYFQARPYLEMLRITQLCDCGLSLDKDTNINYRYSLPNKLFDYFKCRLPVVVSPVVEVRSLVERYAAGEVTPVEARGISQALLKVEEQGRAHYLEGLNEAAAAHTGEGEMARLKVFLDRIAAS